MASGLQQLDPQPLLRTRDLVAVHRVGEPLQLGGELASSDPEPAELLGREPPPPGSPRPAPRRRAPASAPGGSAPHEHRRARHRPPAPRGPRVHDVRPPGRSRAGRRRLPVRAGRRGPRGHGRAPLRSGRRGVRPSRPVGRRPPRRRAPRAPQRRVAPRPAAPALLPVARPARSGAPRRRHGPPRPSPAPRRAGRPRRWRRGPSRRGGPAVPRRPRAGRPTRGAGQGSLRPPSAAARCRSSAAISSKRPRSRRWVAAASRSVASSTAACTSSNEGAAVEPPRAACRPSRSPERVIAVRSGRSPITVRATLRSSTRTRPARSSTERRIEVRRRGHRVERGSGTRRQRAGGLRHRGRTIADEQVGPPAVRLAKPVQCSDGSREVAHGHGIRSPAQRRRHRCLPARLDSDQCRD